MSRTLRFALAAASVLLLAGLFRAALAGAPIKAADYDHPVRVACVGDSITFGAGIHDRQKNHYPRQLGNLLGEKWEVRNFGVSGATLLKRGDKPYWKERACQAALDFQPDAVVIKLGTNDTKPQNWRYKADYAADYREMIAAFRKVNPKVRVYVCLPVPAYPGRWGIRDHVIRGEVVPLARQVAEATGAEVIDLYQALSGKKELFPDTVHPNKEGAAVIAATVYQALTGKQAPAAEPEPALK